MNMRKCEDCTEHKGIEERLNSGDKMMDRFEKFMDHQIKRTEHIFIGIIFILLTGLISVGIQIYQYDQKDVKKLPESASIEKISQNHSL